MYYVIYSFIDGSTFFGVKSSFYESPLVGYGSLMRSYVTFYCVHTAHSRYNITSMDDVVVGDPPSILLCKHDCRIVKSTNQHVEPSKKHTILNA